MPCDLQRAGVLVQKLARMRLAFFPEDELGKAAVGHLIAESCQDDFQLAVLEQKLLHVTKWEGPATVMRFLYNADTQDTFKPEFPAFHRWCRERGIEFITAGDVWRACDLYEAETGNKACQ